MPDQALPGRSYVTRRAIVDVVRTAVVGSYGVTGIAGDSPVARAIGRLGIGRPGIVVRLHRGLEVDLRLTIASGLPVAEVARQVDSAVRYMVRRALGVEVRRLTVHVGGLRYQPASVPPVAADRAEVGSASGAVTAEPAAEETDAATVGTERQREGAAPAGGG